jgi:hypothetical protein
MITVHVDLGTVNERLARLASAAADQARIVGACAAEYTEATLDYIQAGRSFTSRTGQLEQSIGWAQAGPDTARVYAQAEHATYIEKGTGLHGPKRAKYPIRPRPGRKALRFPGGPGGDVVVAGVMHPGIEAQPFLFADLPARQDRLRAAVLRVLSESQPR